MIRPTLDGWSVRLRMGTVDGKAVRPWLKMPAMKPDQAEARYDRLQRLATEFVRAGKASEAEKTLRLCAMQRTPTAFEAYERAARRHLTTDPEAAPKAPRTFRDVAELWLNGDLARRYPDDGYSVSEQRAKTVRAHLALIYPRLGHLPVTEITRELAEQVRAETALGRRQGTRRHYALAIRYVLDLAVEPLRLLSQSPLPRKFVPPQGTSRARAFLFPAEERALVTAPAVPWVYRFYYGFLARNGLRKEEALGLTYGDVDMKTGLLHLDRNKTRSPRFWKLEPDVLRAIERARGDAKPTALLFPGVPGANAAQRFRKHIARAGLERAQLSAQSTERRPIVLHDLRATFATLALASGRTETWVMDRTGHTTSAMLARYRRHARQIEQLPADERWLAPLDECLWPDRPGLFRMDQRMDQNSPIEDNLAANANTCCTESGFSVRTEQPKTAAALRSNNAGPHLGPSPKGGVDQKTGLTLPALTLAEPTLRRLLELATKAREWGIAGELTAQLEAVEAARPRNVTRLDDRRKR